METITLEQAHKKRNLVITNRDFPQHSWREYTSFSSTAPNAHEARKAISRCFELVCRWVYIQQFPSAEERLRYHIKKAKDALKGKQRFHEAVSFDGFLHTKPTPTSAVKTLYY